jgi:hypothetical protein
VQISFRYSPIAVAVDVTHEFTSERHQMSAARSFLLVY